MINTFYDSKSKEKEGNIIYKKIYDKSETVNVEDQYKVKCEGFDSRGRNVKLSCFSINMYHTTSSLLVNGTKMHMFLEDHLPEIMNCMKSYTINGGKVNLNALNKCIYSTITENISQQKINTSTENENPQSNTNTEYNNSNGHDHSFDISTPKNIDVKVKQHKINIDSDTGIVCKPVEPVDITPQSNENILRDENSLTTLVHQLINTTESLTELVKLLDKQRIEYKKDFDNKFNQVNDRITTVSKQIGTNDEHQTEK